MSLEPVSIKLNIKKKKCKGKKESETETKKTEIDHARKKKCGWKKEKLLLKNIRLRSREKNHPPLMLQNSSFAVPVLICRKPAQADGRRRVKEMGQFVEQSSCVA